MGLIHDAVLCCSDPFNRYRYDKHNGMTLPKLVSDVNDCTGSGMCKMIGCCGNGDEIWCCVSPVLALLSLSQRRFGR